MSDKVEIPWADAPDWAIAAAMDKNNQWHWHGLSADGRQWNEIFQGINPNPPPAADWRKSLQLRPVDAAQKSDVFFRSKPSAERPVVFEPGPTVEPSPFLLELADMDYCFHIDEDGITAWREDGDG